MSPSSASDNNFTLTDRVYQWLLICSVIGLSWLLMQVIHEVGHVIHLWISGGVLKEVILHPLTISQTKTSYNPHPLLFWWGGFVWGVSIPWLLFGINWLVDRDSAYPSGFFAGFCLIANGSYLVGGSISMVGDPAALILLGMPVGLLIIFGLLLWGIGLYLWNGLGPNFGLGKDAKPVNRTAAIVCCISLLILISLEFTLSNYE